MQFYWILLNFLPFLLQDQINIVKLFAFFQLEWLAEKCATAVKSAY